MLRLHNSTEKMAKNNAKKTGKKKATAARRVPRSKPKLTQYEEALRNPFGEAGIGAKIPDFDSRVSATWRSCDYSTITTDAAGYACTVYRFSNPGIAYTNTLSNTAGVFKLNGGSSGSYSDFGGPLAYGISTCDSVRPVAGGLRLVPYQNATTAQGKVYVVPLSEHQVSVWAGNTTGLTESAFRRMADSKTYSLATLTLGSAQVVARSYPCDPTAYMYIPPDSGYPTRAFEANTLCFAVVVIGASASTTILDVEQVCHWEFLPGTSYEGLAGKAAPYSPGILERVANFVTNSQPIQDAAQAVSGFALDSVMNFLYSPSRMPLRLTNG